MTDIVSGRHELVSNVLFAVTDVAGLGWCKFALNHCTAHTAEEGRRTSQQLVHEVKQGLLATFLLTSHHVMQESGMAMDQPEPTNAPDLGCQRGLREHQLTTGSAGCTTDFATPISHELSD